MFDRLRNITSNQSNQSPMIDKSDMGIVYHVVLDVDDAVLDILEIPSDLKPLFIGAIQFRSNRASTKSDEYLPLAIPYTQNYTSIPTKNEVVRIINAKGGGFYYERIIKSQIPNVSNADTAINENVVDDKSTKPTSKNYSNVEATGIARSSSDSSTNYDGFGNYFELNPNIHYLKLYEGDTLIQSRFGQSIRFSAYNNAENIFSPTTIIRNGENPETLNAGNGISTEENVNNDENIIFLGSGERLLDYILPIENKKESFFNYPNELKGNQILLNSDRIILSAKNAEMIGVAKKDIGFITDGQFSIDATQGINITTDNHIFVDTKNRDINFNIGNGTIALGTDGALEAAVKGETLKDILYDFMVIVAQQIFVTPSGPTSPGPTNNPQINSLVARLNDMLSNNVQLK